MNRVVRRGDIFWANLDPTIGIEIKKVRPVVVVSNNVINQHSQLQEAQTKIEDAQVLTKNTRAAQRMRRDF